MKRPLRLRGEECSRCVNRANVLDCVSAVGTNVPTVSTLGVVFVKCIHLSSCMGTQLLSTHSKSSIRPVLAVSVHTAWPVMHGPYFMQLDVDR